MVPSDSASANSYIVATETAEENSVLTMQAPEGYKINQILFASYGTPIGTTIDESCHAPDSLPIVTAAIENENLSILASNDIFGDPCGGTYKHLTVSISYEQLVVTNPLPPTNLVASLNPSTVTLTWDRPETGTAVERFAVFWSSDNWMSGRAVASTTGTITLPLTVIEYDGRGKDFSFKIRSDNDSLRLYSEWSNVATIFIPLASSVTPTPTAEPSPSPTPTPTSTPQPQPSPSPEPTLEPSASPTPSPEPSPTPTAQPQPSQPPVTPTPEPTPSPTPSPDTSTATPTQPTPQPTPIPSPTPTPIPSPEPSPSPSPLPSPVGTPSVEPTPAPVVEPTPNPIPLPEPSPNPEVPPALDPEPVTLPENEPIVPPDEEPLPEPSENPTEIDPLNPIPEPLPSTDPETLEPLPPTEEPQIPQVPEQIDPIPEEEDSSEPAIEIPTEPIPLEPSPQSPSTESSETSELVTDIIDDGKITPADVELVVDSLMADGEVTEAEATALVETLTENGSLNTAEKALVVSVLSADGKITQTEVNNLSENLSSDGNFTSAERTFVADVLIESANGEAVTVESIADAGISLEDLPDEQPVEVRQDENGNEVVITAEVAVSLELLTSAGEIISAIFESPAQLLFAIGNLGADMSPEEREEASKTVIAATIVGNIATTTIATSVGSIGYRRPN